MAMLPLAGFRLVDLSRVLAGPLAAMTLGDLGAEVIKIERPVTGDETRGWGPPFDAEGASAYYLSVNRNKLSVALDLETPAEVRMLESLIRTADVVIDNFRPGTLERRGLDVSAMMADQRELLWCTITGEPAGSTMKVGVALADVLAGKDATISILAGLASRGRGRTAAERRTFVSLAASAVAALVNVAQNALVSGQNPARWGNAHANLVPYELFHTADRPIVIAVGSDSQWKSCARALGLDVLAADERLATNAGRIANRDTVVAAMAERVGSRPASYWLTALARVGVPAGIVRTVPEALADVDASPLTGVAPNAPGTVRLPPPKLDEHGALVRQYGWGAFERLTPTRP